MTPIAPLMLFGWLFLGIAVFKKRDPRDAIIVIVVGGVLFLPEVVSFKIPMLPAYNKLNAIAFSLIIGGLASGKMKGLPFSAKDALDVPMIVYCFVSPIATSLANGLGLYNGISGVEARYLSFGVPFWIGRQYFRDAESMRKLTYSMVVGGLIYLPLILFEVRMSPQLCRWIYGFFPHSFAQHIRYGGFRPIVFMGHGLAVALWSALSTIVIYWLWRSGSIKKIKKVPMLLVVLAMIAGTVVCKSAGPLIFMAVGLALYSVIARTKSPLIFTIMLVIPFAYFALRVSGVLPISVLESYLEKYFDPERVQSAMTRLIEEDLFGARARLQPIFGWGGYGRGWPRDPRTGERLISMVDSLWIIEFNTYGIVGLLSLFLTLTLGPWSVVREYAKRKALSLKAGAALPIDGLLLSFLCCLLILDNLMNANLYPMYVMTFGALGSYAVELRAMRTSSESLPAPDAAAREIALQL